MDDAVDGYLAVLTSVLEDSLAQTPVATLVTGSLPLGDFAPASSDIDVIVITPVPPSDGERLALAESLRHSTLPCPAFGLDLLVYPQDEVRPPSRVPNYSFSIATGRDWTDEVSMGGPYAGGLIDLAVARQSGTRLGGAAPVEVIGDLPPEWLRAELERSLHWHEGHVHDPFHDPGGANAVLNAARALHFLATGLLIAKGRAANAALPPNLPRDLIMAAIAWRDGSSSTPLPRDRVLAFLTEASAAFQTGAT